MQDLAAVAFVLVPTPVIPSSSRPVIPPSSRPVIPPPSRVVVPPIIVPLHGPRLVVPIPVVASRHPYQDARHTVRIDPIKPGLGRTGTVPAVRPPTPVPAPVEEDLLPEPFHHLDPGLNHHEGRGDRQAELNPDAHLGPGWGSTRSEKNS